MPKSNIQAVVFDNKKWSTTTARAWLKKHKLNSIKRVDKKGNQLRYRIQSPRKFKTFITKKTKSKLLLIIGFK